MWLLLNDVSQKWNNEKTHDNEFFYSKIIFMTLQSKISERRNALKLNKVISV